MQSEIFIVLVEDDMDDQMMLIDSLYEIAPSMQVKCFSNGQEVVDFLSGDPASALPSLIILDYNMPRFNGLEVLQWLNRHDRFGKITRVVWSTSHTEKMIADCTSHGAKEFYKKPINQQGYEALASSMLNIAGK